MIEYQLRTPDLKSIWCTWPEHELSMAIREYDRLADRSSDIRHGCVLVQENAESHFEAMEERLRWIEQKARNPEGLTINLCLNFQFKALEKWIDERRAVPERKLTVIRPVPKIPAYPCEGCGSPCPQPHTICPDCQLRAQQETP